MARPAAEARFRKLRLESKAIHALLWPPAGIVCVERLRENATKNAVKKPFTVTHNITSPRDHMADYDAGTLWSASLSREPREGWLQDIIKSGGVGERLKPAVLKTVGLERASGVRIPPPPPEKFFSI
jgi:hypothetical protein